MFSIFYYNLKKNSEPENDDLMENKNINCQANNNTNNKSHHVMNDNDNGKKMI